MTVRYRVLMDAKREVVESSEWYEQEQPGLGGSFVLDYESVIEHMRNFPQTGSLVTGLRLRYEVRQFMFNRFKHSLFTVVLPDELVVVAVAHQHRRPGYWRKRLAKVKP